MVGSSGLGPFPSRSEVDKALAALLRFWNGASSQIWMDSLIGGRDPTALISSGFEKLVRALRLLQAEPVIKMLVISLVMDKAFWAAVASNEAVRKVQELFTTGENGRLEFSMDVDLTSTFLSWFLEMVKEKILELVDKFKSLVNELVNELTQPSSTTTSATSNDEHRAQLEEKVGSSFLLSIVILFMVVLTRMTSI